MPRNTPPRDLKLPLQHGERLGSAAWWYFEVLYRTVQQQLNQSLVAGFPCSRYLNLIAIEPKLQSIAGLQF
jgi:hypothetical protein